MKMEPPEQFGPIYPNLGARVAKFRKIPRDKMTDRQKQEYSEAIEAAILSLQRSELMRACEGAHRAPCASGTWHSDGDKIAAAIRERQRRDLQAYCERVRRERTPGEWQELYEAAMKAKRKRGAKYLR